MIAGTKGAAGELGKRQNLLIEANVAWLCQGKELLEQIDDATYTASSRSFSTHRVGGHLRHILEFYECFLDGMESSHIDYDSRKRDVSLETHRCAALAKIDSIIHALRTERALLSDRIVWVRMEDAQAVEVSEIFMISSTGRELQTLSSHTIHHFALIAMTLRAMGYEVDRDFGVAPSTLRYRVAQERAAIPAEAA